MELIEKMKTGDKNAIIDGLFHKGALYRANGIVFDVRAQYKDPMIIRKIQELAEDDTYLFGHNAGYCVADFAIAALDIMKIQKYSGNRKEILGLIGCGMNF